MTTEIETVDDKVWPQVKILLEQLYKIVDELQTIFPDRKFTPDGHLVGSIGEVIAAYMYDLNLLRSSTKGHDGEAIKDGKRVQIKFTQGKSGYEIGEQPDHLIALRLENRKNIIEVFNGPGHIAWTAIGKRRANNEYPLSIKRLEQAAKLVTEEDKIPRARFIKL